MKICVINYSGNVGKSTIAAHMLHPRLKAPVLSVESLNLDAGTDGIDVEKVKARNFAHIQEQVMLADRIVVDVGASNADEFLRQMQASDGSHDDYDLFVVPVVRSRKQQLDTVNTLRSLRTVGVAADRIRVVFNAMETDESVRDAFGPVYALGDGEYYVVRDQVVVHYNEVFERLKGGGLSLADLLSDTTDWKARLGAAADDEERRTIVRRIATRRLAVSAAANLDRAFAALVA